LSIEKLTEGVIGKAKFLIQLQTPTEFKTQEPVVEELKRVPSYFEGSIESSEKVEKDSKLKP